MWKGMKKIDKNGAYADFIGRAIIFILARGAFIFAIKSFEYKTFYAPVTITTTRQEYI